MPNDPISNDVQPDLIQEFDIQIKKSFIMSSPLRVSEHWLTNGVWGLKRSRIKNQTIFTCQCCLFGMTGCLSLTPTDDSIIEDMWDMNAVMERWVRTDFHIDVHGVDFTRYLCDDGRIAYVLRSMQEHLHLVYLYGDAPTQGLWNASLRHEADIVVVANEEPGIVRLPLRENLQATPIATATTHADDDFDPFSPFEVDDDIAMESIQWSEPEDTPDEDWTPPNEESSGDSVETPPNEGSTESTTFLTPQTVRVLRDAFHEYLGAHAIPWFSEIVSRTYRHPAYMVSSEYIENGTQGHILHGLGRRSIRTIIGVPNCGLHVNSDIYTNRWYRVNSNSLYLHLFHQTPNYSGIRSFMPYVMSVSSNHSVIEVASLASIDINLEIMIGIRSGPNTVPGFYIKKIRYVKDSTNVFESGSPYVTHGFNLEQEGIIGLFAPFDQEPMMDPSSELTDLIFGLVNPTRGTVTDLWVNNDGTPQVNRRYTFGSYGVTSEPAIWNETCFETWNTIEPMSVEPGPNEVMVAPRLRGIDPLLMSDVSISSERAPVFEAIRNAFNHVVEAASLITPAQMEEVLSNMADPSDIVPDTDDSLHEENQTTRTRQREIVATSRLVNYVLGCDVDENFNARHPVVSTGQPRSRYSALITLQAMFIFDPFFDLGVNLDVLNVDRYIHLLPLGNDLVAYGIYERRGGATRRWRLLDRREVRPSAVIELTPETCNQISDVSRIFYNWVLNDRGHQVDSSLTPSEVQTEVQDTQIDEDAINYVALSAGAPVITSFIRNYDTETVIFRSPSTAISIPFSSPVFSSEGTSWFLDEFCDEFEDIVDSEFSECFACTVMREDSTEWHFCRRTSDNEIYLIGYFILENESEDGTPEFDTELTNLNLMVPESVYERLVQSISSRRPVTIPRQRSGLYPDRRLRLLGLNFDEDQNTMVAIEAFWAGPDFNAQDTERYDRVEVPNGVSNPRLQNWYIDRESPLLTVTTRDEDTAQRDWTLTHEGRTVHCTFIPDFYPENGHYVCLTFSDHDSRVRNIPASRLESRTYTGIRNLLTGLIEEEFNTVAP